MQFNMFKLQPTADNVVTIQGSSSRTHAGKHRLTSVFYNLANKLAVLDIAPDLLRQRVLGVVVFGGQIDVYATALACENFSC